MATKRICSVENCGKPHYGLGYCARHYQRLRIHGSPLGGGPLRDRNTTTCTVNDCDKPARASGYCVKHYRRYRLYGDATEGRDMPTERGEPRRFLDHVVLPSPSAECLLWPYQRAKRGYALINVAGKTRYVSRLVCEAVYGPPPTASHQAAHSCGNGHLGCVTPGHLRWATKHENEADKELHGTRVRGEDAKWSKLTEADVRQIRTLCSAGEPHKKLAEQFTVSMATISDIKCRRNWGWLAD